MARQLLAAVVCSTAAAFAPIASVVAPLAAALAGERHLLVVPDRDLYALPFAALLEGAISIDAAREARAAGVMSSRRP